MAFGIWRKKQPMALPAPQQGGDPLRADFAAARYGNSCRTLSLIYPYANLPVYRHALGLGPDRGWRILEISAEQPEANLPPRSNIVADKLDFFSAIEHLAEWQEGQIKLGYGVDRAEAETLGIAYFIPFGERENIAFDHLNMPHPTARGEIATTGYFTGEARERAKASIGLPALPRETSGLFELFLARPLVSGESLDALMADAQYHAGLRDLLGIFQEIATAMKYVFEFKLFSDRSVNQFTATRGDFWNAANLEISGGAAFNSRKYSRHLENIFQSSESIQDYVYRRLNDCKSLYMQLEPTDEGKASYDKACSAFKIVLHSMAAKYLAQLSAHKTEGRYYCMQLAEKQLFKSEELFASLLQNKDERFSAASFAFDGDSPKTPAIIASFLKDFEQAIKKSEDQARVRKTRLLPPPANSKLGPV